jgi:hypothetical protein
MEGLSYLPSKTSSFAGPFDNAGRRAALRCPARWRVPDNAADAADQQV